MTREGAKNFLTSLGIQEPSDSQITDYLNSINGEVKRERDMAERYKADALKVKDYEAQLEEINNKSLSEIELTKKEVEKANKQNADLQKEIDRMKRKNKLAEMGIVGEQADAFFDESGAINFETLSAVLENTKTTAKNLMEKELLDGTLNPKGSDKLSDAKTDAENMAVNVGKQIAASNKATDSVLANYIK